ncbi:dipeptidyl aminopeptidase-like protein 6 [Trichonephila inaurata madagascariensis]|uniref:Dipeptidyl aminopeptidase-like protein 6 n=1 Tax=Trichonephila inaurata madagascariensis TaxID=2747483 RepID=A0A8X7CND7_9ARAC|nr:dipeptidyl aminopeptidase-like protein 6 [Trichonephila inaurata madagascariensis]
MLRILSAPYCHICSRENFIALWGLPRAQVECAIMERTEQTSEIYDHRPPGRKGWVDLYDPLVFGHGGKSWFMKLPQSEGNSGHFRQIAVAHNETRLVEFITEGKFDITKIAAYHEGSNTIPNVEYFVLECLGPGVPKIEIRSIYNQTMTVLDTNNDLKKRVEQRTMPQIRTFHVPVKSGYKAQVRLLLPPDLAGNEASLYPLVLFADGSPGSQLVTEEFKIHWGTYLSGRRNQIYAWIDGRGSGNQGDKMLNEIYYHLGTAEIQDQIDVIR